MNGELYIGGKKYISAKRAALFSGYADDYIGQLSRNNKLVSAKIGRTWFVSEESLLGYMRDATDGMYAVPAKKKTRRQKAKNKRLIRTAKEKKLPPPQVIIFEARTLLSDTPVQAPVEPAPSLKIIRLSELGKILEGSVSLSAVIEESAEASEFSDGHAVPISILAEPAASVAASVRDSDASWDDEVTYVEDIPLPVYHAKEKSFFGGLGAFALASALAIFVLAIFPNVGSLYRNMEAGTRSLGMNTNSSFTSIEDKLNKSPLYFGAGLAAVDSAFGSLAAPSENSSHTYIARTSFLESIGNSIEDRMNALAFAVFDGVNTIFNRVLPSGTNIYTTRLADNDTGEPVPDDIEDQEQPAGQNQPPSSAGMAIVPSTGNSSQDSKITSYIQNSFSDDVEVVSKNDDGTGVIRPVFKDRKGDDYLYVLVPVSNGG